MSLKKIGLSVILLSAAAAVVPQPLGQQTILGVLEDVPGGKRGVRVAFQKHGTDWTAFPTGSSEEDSLKTLASRFPTTINWTIAFDGKSLGHVTGRTPEAFRFRRQIGLQEITSNGSIPTVGGKSVEYAGDSDIPAYRPLVANSEPYVNDPEAWNVSRSLPPEFRIKLRDGFRQKFPKLCRASKTNPSTLKSFHYRDEDVRILKAYASKSGTFIARLHLDGAIDCNDAESGFELDDPWFAVISNRTVLFLDAGIWLVDAGDYDNDGRSELVFSITRDNRGGYELFYDEFQKHAVFEFSYH